MDSILVFFVGFPNNPNLDVSIVQIFWL